MENEFSSKRTKHIHLQYHFVLEKAAENSLFISYLPAAEMAADALTRPLP